MTVVNLKFARQGGADEAGGRVLFRQTGQAVAAGTVLNRRQWADLDASGAGAIDIDPGTYDVRVFRGDALIAHGTATVPDLDSIYLHDYWRRTLLPLQLIEGETMLDLFTFTRDGTAPYTDDEGNPQTAAVNEPRFDHDAQGDPLGLFIQRAALAGGAVERMSSPLGSNHNADEFTTIIHARTAAAYVEDQVLWQMDDGTEANRIRLVRHENTRVHLQATSAGADIVDIDLGPVADETDLAVGLRVGSGRYAASLDGGDVETANGERPAGLSVRRLGGSTPEQTEVAEWSDSSAWQWSDGSAVDWITDSELTWDGHVRYAEEVPRLQSNAELEAA